MMAVTMTENKMFHLVLRALQIVFAVIVMGTTGYGTYQPTHPTQSPD
jgi:hypothetical protein